MRFPTTAQKGEATIASPFASVINPGWGLEVHFSSLDFFDLLLLQHEQGLG